MRMVNLLLAGAVVVWTAGCRAGQNATPAASGSAPVTQDPVGPIPGLSANVSYTTDPLINDPVALQDGRRLFNWYNCSGCHGGHGGGGMGPSLRDQVWLYGSKDGQIFQSIAQGRSKGMPAWGTKIPAEQIWELVAYIKSMRTPQEPDPPIEPTNEETPNPMHNTPLGEGTQTTISEAK
jgi:cytochrome c oxidase cbb3-type subunit 3